MCKLSKVFFGYADAEEEFNQRPELFDSAFVDPHNYLDKILNDSKYLILGRKGSGKTAFSAKIRRVADLSDNITANPCSLADMDYVSFNRFAEANVAGGRRFHSIWKFLLMTEILKMIFNEFPERENSKLTELYEGLKSHGFITGDSLVRVATKIRRTQIVLNVAEIFKTTADIEHDVTLNGLDEIADLILETIRDSYFGERKFFLIIDGLDDVLRLEDFSPDIVTGLIRAISYINKSFSKAEVRVKVVLLMRTDKINAADLVLDNDEIAVELLSNGMPYRLVAFTRNKSDFKLNYISAYLYDGISPNMIDERIFKSKLCRTSAPSDQQISEAKQTASSMLEEMGLGEWYIDNAQVETKYYGDIPEYSIRITATPVFNTANVIRQPQLSNLKRDDVFASNYYLTDAEFIFSPNGQLIRFEMYSPVDVEKVIVDNVKTLEMLEQFECAKNILALSEYRDYLLSQDLIEELEKTNKESLICKVEISDFEYGLTRIKAPNEDDIYYYIPGILLKGSIDYLGKDSHNIYASTGLELGPDRTLSLITLNSIDGTIIHN